MFAWISSFLGKIFGKKGDSQQLVDRLDIPAKSKLFVVALRVPDDPSCIVYLLTTQVLSERSVRDVQCLVAAVRPQVVVAAVQSHLVVEFLEEEDIVRDLDSGVTVPSSFLDAVASNKPYSADNLAAIDFQRIIFGTSYHGYAIAAKSAAIQIGSNFQLLEVFFADQSQPEEAVSLEKSRPFSWQYQLEFLDSFSAKCPQFAGCFFPIFLMLDELNGSIWPRMHGSNAVAAAERIIADVAAGKEVSRELLEAVRGFRVTLEYFRLLQNSVAGRIARQDCSPPFASVTYDTLSDQEKCEVLLAQALQRQARKSKVVVAALDGSQVLGVRKFWNISVTPEVAALSDSFVFSNERSLQDEGGGSLVALGAGAAAAAGAAKLLSGKTPGLVKLHWTAFSPARSSLIRSVVGLAKRRSIGAVHWSFYGLMRHRAGLTSTRRPWMAFGGSVVTAAGLFYAGDQIVGAVEAFPLAISVARLGRGLDQLKRTAAEVDSQPLDGVYERAYRVPWL